MEITQISSPADLRKLNYEQCYQLADEIRAKIVDTVAKNGGHLSSNLGIVEITLALHRVFDLPTDQLVFDVGHQCYTHKLLTGRYDRFDSLRQFGGLSGFPKREESRYDSFDTGHASTSISAALGMARARDALGKQNHIVAVVGDGALTGGMCYEALNDAGNSQTRMIVILNDNEMSIAKNVGALSKHLSSIRSSTRWLNTKKAIRSGLTHIPVVGQGLYDFSAAMMRSVRSMLVDEKFFGTLGFRYIGPIDGHDLSGMERIFEKAKAYDGPIVIHCCTKKGYGYDKGESMPEQFHSVPPFFVESGQLQRSSRIANGSIAADTLIEQMDADTTIRAITAAMPLGTGVDRISAVYPDRVIDVGITEEHAVTMCAGLAVGGLKPYFFVYSTFLQRAYDQVLHDCCMQKLPVKLMIDRAGLSNGDGESHQGLYDFAYLRHIPNMTVLAPRDIHELISMVRFSVSYPMPLSIRYARDGIDMSEAFPYAGFQLGVWETLMEGGDGTIFAVGSMVESACRVAKRLNEQGIGLTVINASTIKPLDEEKLAAAAGKPIYTIEEHAKAAGFGSAVIEYYSEQHITAQVTLFGVADVFIPQGDHASLLELVGLSEDQLVSSILSDKTATEDKL